VLTKKASKDMLKLKAVKLLDKVKNLLEALAHNATPEYSKKLLGNWSNKHSIRINDKHRLVYEIYEDTKIIKILSMWSHYENL
jgi:Txe/YoeB family toxin of toxin-antitoxin system